MDDNNRFTEDIQFNRITVESMKCAECRHNRGEILECAKFAQKPDGVLEGGECKYFE